MTKIIRILSYIFLGIGFLIILAGYIGVFMSEGFSGVQRLLNPLNVANFVMTLLMLTPGGLLYYWAERRNKRDFEKDNSETDNSVTEEQY